MNQRRLSFPHHFLLFLSILILLPSISFAGTLFGPKEYQRTTDSLNIYEETIKISYEIIIPCTLRIINGGSKGKNRISTVSVSWNDIEVVKENECNQEVEKIDKTIIFKNTNNLKIHLEGKSEGYIKVSILGPNLSKVWQKEYPIGTINDFCGYDFSLGNKEVFMWLYRQDKNAMEYLDSLGNIVYTVPLGDYPVPFGEKDNRKLYQFSGISQNGTYFSKSEHSYREDFTTKYIVKDKQDTVETIAADTSYSLSHTEIDVIDFKGNVISHLDSVSPYARQTMISNDGNIVFIYPAGFLKSSKCEIFNNEVNVLKGEKEKNIFKGGAFSPDGRLYISLFQDTIIAYNSSGEIVRKTPIVGQDYGYAQKDISGFASPTGDKFLIASRPREKWILPATYLLNEKGEIIKILNGLSTWMADFDSSGQYAIITSGKNIYLIETATGDILWQKEVERKKPYAHFRSVYTSPNARLIVTSVDPNFPVYSTNLNAVNTTMILQIFNRSGESLIRKEFTKLQYMYKVEDWTFCRLSRDGRYLAVRTANDKLTLYHLNF
ncbi:MAG: hypothetical protein E3J87_07720 [Candidatus Cloacimonadota bacterium]|nr:MAG: hypothetical protein E3J87_07720 [Candidatus Cloacimonadota bacterium]